MDLAEKQMREGTASAQVITHYLRVNSPRDIAERNLMEKKEKLIETQIEAIKSSKETEKIYADALEAMRNYAGGGRDEGDSDGV
jgi:predicted metal-dependent hydrolase